MQHQAKRTDVTSDVAICMKTTTRSNTSKRTHSKSASGHTDAFGSARRSHAHYLDIARASERLGDHVATESLYQYAEHYIRLMNSRGIEPPSRSEDRYL